MSDRLARRRSLPPGGTIAMRPLRDGWPVRTAVWPGRAGGPGSILFMTGRGDFLEKYAETFHDLVDAGWGVASFDWRGQGLSGRLGDAPMKGHSTGFGVLRDDLDEIFGWFEQVLPGPRFVVAHSMGAHILMFNLVERMHGTQPGRLPAIERHVLLAPMIGLHAPPLGPRLATRLADWMVHHRRGGKYIWGGGDYVAGKPGSKRQRLLTGDPERYADEGWWVAQNPSLATGSPTWEWLYNALTTQVYWRGRPDTGWMMPGHLALPSPMLVLLAENDGLVDNAEAVACFGTMPNVRIEEIAGAGHELLREASDIRARVLARVTAFLETGA